MKRRGEPQARSQDSLAEALGRSFVRPELLTEALTHSSTAVADRSAARHQAGPGSYERLEFLGDRVLGLVVADLLFHAHPEENEGSLAKRHAALVSQPSLALVAEQVGLGEHLLLSRGEEDSGGRQSQALLADACEAIIAALYLDGGLAAAAQFIRRHWEPLMEADLSPPQDPKTALQEWAQGRGLPLPAYRTVRSEGPPHQPVFSVEVEVAGHPAAAGSGGSKRTAERAAAAALLELLPRDDGNG